MKRNKLIVFSAPSGAGKTTLVKHILSQFSNTNFSISATSRSPRGSEKDGVDYHFLSNSEFKKKIEKVLIKKTKNAKRHFSKNHNKRPGNRSIWIWLWNESWDVHQNSSKSGVLQFLPR